MTTQEHKLPQNPLSPAALNIGEVHSGLPFQVWRLGDDKHFHMAESGVFTTKPEYNGDEWQDPLVVIDGEPAQISLQGLGLICSSDGNWRHDVFVTVDDQE